MVLCTSSTAAREVPDLHQSGAVKSILQNEILSKPAIDVPAPTFATARSFFI
jgi:hypothetical protein